MVPYLSHKIRVLWFLFDDASLGVKVGLKKLEKEINEYTFGKGIPVHDHALCGGHSVDTKFM